MSYNILGINTSHNGSVCLLSNGKVNFFLEEERITKQKHDSFPIKLLEYVSNNFQIQEIAVSGLYTFPFNLNESIINLFISKFFPKIKISYYLNNHHLIHAYQSFFNSNFKESLCIVIDGHGSELQNNSFETESIYKIAYNTPPVPIFKSYRTNNNKENFLTFSKVYETITEYLGFGFLEAGKTMGLSSYGKFNPKIPPLYEGIKGNSKIFNLIKNSTGGYINPFYSQFFNTNNLKIDLAYHTQQESQKAIGDLIENIVQKTGLKQICCSGGYFLNCVANYYLTKRFPDVEFYFEPISSDAGIAMGAAKLAWYYHSQDQNQIPQKTLYYGLEYSKKELLNGIQKYV
jgi:carbamoyltransferase